MDQQKHSESNANTNQSATFPIIQPVTIPSSHSNTLEKSATVVTITHDDCIDSSNNKAGSTVSNIQSISVQTVLPVAIADHNSLGLTNLHRGGSAGHLPLSALANLHGGSKTLSKMDKVKRSGNPLSTSTLTTAPCDSKSASKQTSFKASRKDKRSRIRIPMLQPSFLDRPCPHHSFHTDVTDVQKMEQGLVQLLDDFHTGQLQAFGKDCSFQKMERIRDQQEKLARLHFDLGSKQEAYGSTLKEGCGIDKDHITQLMSKLQELNLAIEELHPNTSGNNLQTEV